MLGFDNIKRKSIQPIRSDDRSCSNESFRLQSAMEYLVSYGWIIIVIAVVVGVLYGLGIFNPGALIPAHCTLSGEWSCVDYVMNTQGMLELKVMQNTGSDIAVTGVACYQNSSNIIETKPTNNVKMYNGQEQTFFVYCYDSSGSLFDGASQSIFNGYVTIYYINKVNGLAQTITGTIGISPSTAEFQEIGLSGYVYRSIPITVYSSAATVAPFQQMLTIDSADYSQYINSGWSNVEFTTGNSTSGINGTVLQAWVESGNSNTDSNTIVWVNLPGGEQSGYTTIYMNFMSSNVMASSGPTGEAPELSNTYAQYDNGAQVFTTLYTNFAGPGLPSGWTVSGTSPSYTIDNGLQISENGGSSWEIENISSYGVGFVNDYYGNPGYSYGNGNAGNTEVAGGFGLQSYGWVDLGLMTDYYCGGCMYFSALSSAGYPNIPKTGNHVWTIARAFDKVTLYTQFNYSTVATTTLSSPNTGAQPDVGFVFGGMQTGTIYWDRIRPAPPNGTMPLQINNGSGSPKYLYSVPITLTNNNGATATPFQQMLKIDSADYSQYINSGWSNVEFTTGNGMAGSPGNILQAWVESGASNTGTGTVVWVNMPNGVPSGTSNIYMNFMSYNVMTSSGPTGEAPQLSPAYAQYDNGALVFPFYENFAGTQLINMQTGSGSTQTINNGLTIASQPYNTILYSLDTYSPVNTIVEMDNWVTDHSGALSNFAIGEANSISTSGVGYLAWDEFEPSVSYPSMRKATAGCCSLTYLEGGTSTTPGSTITGFLWDATGTENAWFNYTASSITTTDSSYPQVNSYIMYFGQAGGYDGGTYWIRTRTYPPAGVMPSASGAGVT